MFAEVLRGGFLPGKGSLRIRIAPRGSVVVPLAVHTLNSHSVQQAGFEANELLVQAKERPFNMMKPPLFSATAVQLPPEAAQGNSAKKPVWKLLLVLHHAGACRV